LHPLHQLPKVCTCGSREDIPSVTEIVKVERGQISTGQRWEPHPAAEVGVPQRAPARGRLPEARASERSPR
jgi:hypothetical protein